MPLTDLQGPLRFHSDDRKHLLCIARRVDRISKITNGYGCGVVKSLSTYVEHYC